MEIKRGDRVKLLSGAIIEYVDHVADTIYAAVRVVAVGSEKSWRIGEMRLVGEMHMVSSIVFQYWEHIAPAETDPLIREVVEKMKDLEFARKLAETAMIVWPTLEESKKQAYAAILRDVLPLELKRQIRPGKLCEDCNKEISDIIEDMK